MRIGAVTAESGATAKTIRFYEQTGLLPEPPRTSSGYRDYPPETTTRLEFIRTAQNAGLTLAEIRSILAIRDDGQPPCAHVTALLEAHLAEVERRMAELESTSTALRGLLATAAAADPATCAGEGCRILA